MRAKHKSVRSAQTMLAGPQEGRGSPETSGRAQEDFYLSTPITSKASILMYLPARLVGSHQILTV